MKKEWKIEHSGAQIRLVNSWSNGAKLYIDGDLKDFDFSKIATSAGILLSGSFIDEHGERQIVEVIAKSKLFTVAVIMTANGVEILRDKF